MLTASHHPLHVYAVTLGSGTRYLLAPNSEEAAWAALELSHERNDNLINVRIHDEWEEEVFS
jgi:hypothetical protein